MSKSALRKAGLGNGSTTQQPKANKHIRFNVDWLAQGVGFVQECMRLRLRTSWSPPFTTWRARVTERPRFPSEDLLCHTSSLWVLKPTRQHDFDWFPFSILMGSCDVWPAGSSWCIVFARPEQRTGFGISVWLFFVIIRAWGYGRSFGTTSSSAVRAFYKFTGFRGPQG